MQSSVFRLLLLIVLALGVLLLLRPGTISQLKSLADSFSGRTPTSGPTTPANPQTECPAPIVATTPAAPLAEPSQANSGDAGETSLSDDPYAAGTYHWPPPLEITLPTPPVEPGRPAAGNVTVTEPSWGAVAGLPGSADRAIGQANPGSLATPSGSAAQPMGETQVGSGPDFRPPPMGLLLSPPPAPDNPLRGIPPPVEQDSGFAPPQGAGLPRVPQGAGFAPAPNAGLPPPNQPDRPPPTDPMRTDLPAAPMGPNPQFQQPMNQPPPDNRLPDNRTADAYRPAPVSPRLGSGPVQEPPSAIRPQESPLSITPLLEPIRVASVEPGGLSFSSGSPGAPGSAGGFSGSTAAGPEMGPALTTVSSEPGKQLCKGAEKVAQVGSQVILASDLNVAFNIWQEKQKKSKKPLPPEQIEKQRTEIEVALLKQMTEEIILYQDILRQVPEEALKSVRDKVSEVFETEELPSRIKSEGLASRAELVEKLEKLGTSLEREKRNFVQTMLAQQWLQQQVKKDDETFTPDEILNYYRQHQAEFEHKARVKWEELMVRKSRHPGRDEAVGLLGHMGNQVLDGAKLNEVARAGSEGSTACDGGLHDWTNKGSLVSNTLENAIFSLPVGQLSQIIETDTGYHIVRVIQRQDESVTPFLEAQVEIRNKIVRQRKQKQIDEYIAKLHERTPVWTKFDALIAQQQKASSFLER